MAQLINKEQVLGALSYVIDPDLKQDLVSLGMIKDISFGPGAVNFTVVLTTPACPLKEIIRKACVEAIHTHISPDLSVHIIMDAQVTSIRSSAPLLPQVRNIVAISSGKGGVGKSTITANLAMALASSGARVGIIDADISGPSIPIIFGIEDQKPEIRQIEGKNYIVPIEKMGIPIISIGFLAAAESAVVWRGPMMSSALKQFIADTLWPELDYLLIDLPPGTSDIHLTLVQTLPLTGVVVVTTPQKVALADALKGLMMFKQPSINVPILGIVENMAWFSPQELPDNKYYIFGKGGGASLADRFDTPLLAQIPLVQSICETADSGVALAESYPTTAQYFQDLAQQLARQIAIRNAELPVSKIVQMES